MREKLTNEMVFGYVYTLKKSYPDLGSDKYDKRFNFAASRTISNLQPIASDLLKARETSLEKYKEFEVIKNSIIISYNDGNFESDVDRNKCQQEVNELVKEYEDVLKERQKEIEIYNEILETEVEVDIIKCKFEALPNDFNFEILRGMVKETDDEIEELI